MTKHSDRTAARRNRADDALRAYGAILAAELEAMDLLFDLGARLRASADMRLIWEEMLDAAIEMLGSFMGYIRLYHVETGVLEFIAHRGIRHEFLDDFHAENALCERAIRNGKRVVIKDLRTDPSCTHQHEKIASSLGYRALQATPLTDSGGRPIGILCTHFRQPRTPSMRELRMLDVYVHQAGVLVGRIRAEEALRDSEARFRSLAEASPALIWQLNPDGDAIYLNGRYQDLTGKRLNELMKSGWHAVLHPDDAPEYLAALRQTQNERTHLRQRVRVQCGDGSWRLLESYALPWFDARNEYGGHVGMSIDITDAIQLEQIQSTYRMSTEGGDEGFYILRPVHDSHKAIVDFEFIDSNHCGALYLGHRRENLIGKKISSLFYGGGNLERPMKILRHAMKMAFYENEVEISRGGPMKLHWIHCKIVRSHGDLAITVRDITEAKEHVDELERRGNEDTLTGLPNRYWIQNYLARATERAAATASSLALLFIDLDGFKQVNDMIGHAAGDELLRTAARRLKVAVRPQDKVARLGGDEFVIILENITHQSDAAHVAKRILHAFCEKFTLSQGAYAIGASIGISQFPADAKDAETLLRHADMAMYSVKSNGKRNYRFFDPAFDKAA